MMQIRSRLYSHGRQHSCRPGLLSSGPRKKWATSTAALLRGTLVSAGILVSLLPHVSGASILDFPLLSFNPDVILGVAILNPTTSIAEVRLTAYTSEGEVLAITDVTIPPGQRLGRVVKELFGSDFDPATTGWFQAVSTTNGLTGFFLILNTEVTEFDGAGLPSRGRFLAFSQIGEETSTTELNLANPEGESARVELTLAGIDEPIVRNIVIPARGSASLDAQSFFEILQIPPGAYVLVKSSVDLVGFVLIRIEGGDFVGLNAKSASEFLNTIYFPQMFVLGGVEARLGLVNYSSRPALVTIAAHRSDGSLFVTEVQFNPVSRVIPPGQSLNLSLAELFGFQGEGPFTGWLEVNSSAQGINGYLTYRVVATGAAASIPAVARGTIRAILAHLATSGEFYTEVAALNSATFPANVRFFAQTADGQILGSFDTILQPGEQITRRVSELIPQAANQSGGVVLARSNVPIHFSGIFGTRDGTLLVNIPAQSAPREFRPDATIPVPRVFPPLSVLQPSGIQQFQVQGTSGNVEWLVNGTPGGSNESGLITPAGVYTAPADTPTEQPVRIAAVAGNQTAGSSVDVITLQKLASGLGFVQSLAFLSGLEKLYTAERSTLGGFLGRLQPTQTSGTDVYALDADGNRSVVATIPGDEVPKLLPFLGLDNREYLLMVAKFSGQVLRLEPQTGDVKVLSSGLDLPTALVLDAATGNLLVAEASQVTSIPRRQLESDLIPAATILSSTENPIGDLKTAVLAPLPGITGLAVDGCAGIVYMVQASTGRLLSYQRESGTITVLAEGLSDPGHMVGFYRTGVSCPLSFNVAIVESGAQQVSLYVVLEDLLIRPWVPDISVDDVTLVPSDSPFLGGGGGGGGGAGDPTRPHDPGPAFLFDSADDTNDTNDVVAVELPGLYVNAGENPAQPGLIPNNTTPPGPDLWVSESTAPISSTAVVGVSFRPGDEDGIPGGLDENAVLTFILKFDRERLRFDPTDSNEDGLPDSVVPATSGEFLTVVVYDPEFADDEIGFVIADIRTPFDLLTEGNLLNIHFATRDLLGSADVRLSPAPAPQLIDLMGILQTFSELSDGLITILP